MTPMSSTLVGIMETSTSSGDIVNRVAECNLRTPWGLRQLCSEFRRFGGVAGKRFGLVIKSCVANGGEELLGLCQQ